MMRKEMPGLTCKDARAIGLINFLAELGITPCKIRGDNYWYLSPLRNERHASFKVSKQLNRWYDFGTGMGGNILDFGLLYFGCCIPELLSILSGGPHTFRDPLTSVIQAPGNRIISNTHLSHPALIQYFTSRKIDPLLAKHYCREVHYENNGKTYFAIGFKNDLGGYELRSKYFKGSTSPKYITSILTGADTALLFEGFFDFLSYLVLSSSAPILHADYYVLNSLSFIEPSLIKLQSYRRVGLLLDNDTAGQEWTAIATKRHPGQMVNLSGLYQSATDLNLFLCSGARSFPVPLTEALKPP